MSHPAPDPQDGGLAAPPSTAGIQAAISIATGIPSQGIDLLKAQCRRSWPAAAESWGYHDGVPASTRLTLLFPSVVCLGNRQENKAS